MTNRRVVERYWNGFLNGDLETMAGCLDPDVVVTYPQSGEVIRGRDNMMATISNYPAGLPDSDSKVVFDTTEKTAAKTSLFPFGMTSVNVVEDGELIVGQARLTYPNGDVYNTCSIFKVHRQLITEETGYFAAPFDAPEWRSRWVED